MCNYVQDDFKLYSTHFLCFKYYKPIPWIKVFILAELKLWKVCCVWCLIFSLHSVHLTS